MAYVELPISAATWINENATTTAYGTNAFLRLGDAVTTSASTAHVLLKFNLGSIPSGSVIDSAFIMIYLEEKDWATDTEQISSLRALKRNWTEDATWATYNGANPWSTAGGTGSNDIYSIIYQWTRESTDSIGWEFHGQATAAFTQLVQDWHDGTVANYGILLTTTAPSTAAYKNAHKYSSPHSALGASYAPMLCVFYTPDSYPTVTTLSHSSVTQTSIDNCGGDVTDDGGAAITGRGVCYKAGISTPTTSDSKVTASGTTGTFEVDLTGLNEGTTYTYRAYATNSVGTAYGAVEITSTLDISTTNGQGGDGVLSSIDGTEKMYGAGGGGGAYDSSSSGANGGEVGYGTGGNYLSSGTAGRTNRGSGGGGGGGPSGGGGAGGKGVVVVRYLTADATPATPVLSSTSFAPSLCWHNGRLYAPYAKSSGLTTGTITDATVANPTQLTCANHGLLSGQVVVISNSTGISPSLNGVHVATKTGTNTFTIPVTVASATGESATLTYNDETGFCSTTMGKYSTGTMRTSKSSFHTGSIMKDFKHIDITHDELPSGATISVAYTIDEQRYPATEGTYYEPTDTTVTRRTSRFDIDLKGYTIDLEMKITPSSDLTRTPYIYTVNIVWNFEKIPKHLYSLDCRQGAGSGRWQENPEEAIQFLFDAAEDEATFEDRFSGEYTGTIEEIEYNQSPYSLAEGPSGLVKILVREAT